MQGQELRETLRALGWSQAKLASKLGLHVNTVSQWAVGDVPVPGYAIEYLRVLVLAHEIMKGGKQ